MRLLVATAAVPWAAYLVRLLLRSLHILQLEQYQTWQFLRWTVARRERWLGADRTLVPFVGAGLAALFARSAPVFGLIVWIASAAFGWWRAMSAPAKKPLVLTDRARRLLAGQIVLTCGVAFGPAVTLALRGRKQAALQTLIVGSAVAGALCPFLTAAANLLLWPVEEALRRYYARDARRRLRECGPTVVAVAGSYGKTSTKEFLATILEQRWSVLRPPGSHNTPMGISRVIREQLRPAHEYFVAELGDHAPGDVHYLCDLLSPRVGVFTTIGPEHLERFKSMDRVLASKAELVDALPPNGLAVVNQDDPLVRGLGDRARARGIRVVTYGLDQGADVRASDVRTTRRGLAFNVHARGETVELTVRVLGRHNVSNLLAATAVATELGMSLGDVANTALSIRPVEHRLQPIQGEGGVLVIDDAFNSNPRGANEALEVLRDLEGGRRILVTPGMVELAEQEFEENRAFARKAATVCDEVVLVGRSRAAPLLAGLRDAGFQVDHTHVVSSLGEATERLRTLLKSGDIVLFENDLPDQYADTNLRVAVGAHGERPTGPEGVDGRTPCDPTAPTLFVRGLRLGYRESGDGSGLRPVVVLHGWGASVDSVSSIQRCLMDAHRVIAFDLPGFGQSDPPPRSWGSTEYAEAIRAALLELGIGRTYLIGHSFGGKLALILAARHPDLVERLVLVDSAGIRARRGPSDRARVVAYKSARAAVDVASRATGREGQAAGIEWLAKRFGSDDYLQAGDLREVLVRVVNEDMRDLLPLIQAPTMLIWGERDDATPLADGQLMERLIPDAGLVVFPGAGHYPYADDPGRFCRVVGHFLSG